MAKIRINYRDARPVDEISLGAFSQIAAKRRYGFEAMKTEDPEPVLFAAFVEVVGPAAAKDPVYAFDEWLIGVDAFELIEQPARDDDDENPPPAESSGTSPESPPTSD